MVTPPRAECRLARAAATGAGSCVLCSARSAFPVVRRFRPV